MVRPGVSVLIDDRRELLAGKRVGVLTNQTGVLPDLTSTIDALRQAADLRAIWTPEHGLHGAAAEGAHVGSGTDRSGLPIHSLYGSNLAPTPDQLAGLDVIVCDLQDIGCRFYTYTWTLCKLIEAAGAAGVAVIVADRPNPLGGAIEGPGVQPDHQSLVGGHDVPIRHGLTIGELARLVDRERGLKSDLTVIPCDGWQRTMLWHETGLPWVPPSPNMPTPETAIVYPGTCLLEGVNVSVGRGTAKPFEWLGAPWIDGAALAAALNDRVLPGVRWRAIAFEPCSGPYTGVVCEGVQPHVTDAAAYQPVAGGIELLKMLRQLHPDQWAISAAGSIYADSDQMARRGYPVESVWNVAHFDRLAGSSAIRAMIERGAELRDITGTWLKYIEQFRVRTESVRLYA
jgi:uncharacterized protein YbbC (DUF1343 family)